MNHDTDSVTCACNPEVMKLCPECDGDRCALCNFTGLTEATAVEKLDETITLVIIHRDGPDDDMDAGRESDIIRAVSLLQDAL